MIEVFYGCNDTYAQHLAVSIHSLLRTARQPLAITVLDGGITPGNKQLIQEIVTRFAHGSIRFQVVDNALFDKYPICERFSVASYYRCVIHELRPELDKALYLDADVVVRSCISELFATDVNGYYAAVVEDFFYVIDQFKQDLGLAADCRYFNSGVMLLNLRMIREEGVFERISPVLEAIKEITLFYDQDVLNVLFVNRVKFVEPSWNVLEIVYRDKGSRIQHRFYEKDFFGRCCRNPKIIHYANRSTLWFDGASEHVHRFWLEYYRYLKGTGFHRGICHHPLVLLLQKYCTRDNCARFTKWLFRIHLTSRLQVIRICGVDLLNNRRLPPGVES